MTWKLNFSKKKQLNNKNYLVQYVMLYPLCSNQSKQVNQWFSTVHKSIKFSDCQFFFIFSASVRFIADKTREVAINSL